MQRFITPITTKINVSNNTKDIAVAILSAGIGDRIKSYEPRSMIKIGNKTLIEHQISVISSCFDDPEIIAVLGHSAARVIKKLQKRIRVVENQLYKNTNCAESIRLAFHNTIKNNFLFIHGDLYFNMRTLSGLDYNKSFIIIDSNNRFHEKEVGVTINKSGTAEILSYGLPTKWGQIAFLTGKELKILNNIFYKFNTINKKLLSFELLNEVIMMGGTFKCYEPIDMSIIEIDCIKDLKNENFNMQ